MKVKEKVREIIKEQLNPKEKQVSDEARLIEDLGADDLDRVELVMSLEEEFGVEIVDEDADEWKCVRDVVQYMVKKVGGEGK